MAEQAPPAPVVAAKPEGEKRGFGRGGDKAGDKKGGKRPDRKKDDAVEWKPVTKLGRLVKAKLIDNIVDIFRFSIPIKEQEIVDAFLAGNLKEEVMEVKSVQKQTQAGQRTRFKAFAIVGDEKNYIGLGWKCHKEVQGAIKGAITMAKLNIVPVRKGYWGNKIGSTHTVPGKVTGKSGSVKVRLVPAPRGTGWLHLQLPRSSSSSPVFTTFTPKPKERPELEETSSRLLSLLSRLLTNSTHPISGERVQSASIPSLSTESTSKPQRTDDKMSFKS